MLERICLSVCVFFREHLGDDFEREMNCVVVCVSRSLVRGGVLEYTPNSLTLLSLFH